MPFDGIVAARLAEELNQIIAGSRVEKIVQPSRRRIDLLLRRDKITRRLAIETNPESPYLCLTESLPPNLPSATSFLMLLRKHLTGARLDSVTVTDYERVITLTFSLLNEMGDQTTKALVAELTGRYANLILLNRDGVIHDALRHVDASINRVRETLPAHPYFPPPLLDKILPGRLKEPCDVEALFARSSPAFTVQEIIFKNIAGVSPFLAREAVHIACLKGNERLAELDLPKRKLFVLAVLALAGKISKPEIGPTVYFADEKKTELLDYHAYRFTHLHHLAPAASLSEAIDRVERFREKARQFERKKRQLVRDIAKQIGRFEKKAKIHAADVESGKNASDWRQKGELIYANIWRLDAGMTSFSAEPFDGGETMEIGLDRRLTPAANAEQYFRRYRKEKTKFEQSGKRLKEDLSEIAYLKSLSAAANSAEDDIDLEAVRDELEKSKSKEMTEQSRADEKAGSQRDFQPGRPAAKKRRKLQKHKKIMKKKKGEKLAAYEIGYRVYRSSDGFLIRAGRNNLQNDKLTFRDSSSNDLWFHARLAAGSHIVVRTEGKQVPETTILEAAALAARFSEHNRAGVDAPVDIDVTEVKNVKKPPKSRPGYVTYDRFRTIRVSPGQAKTLGQPALP